MRSLDIAATGLQAQQTMVEVLSNNIANINTTGFKRQRAEFQDLLYQDLRRVGSDSSDQGTIVPAGVQIGVGVRTAATYRISEQGNLTSTDNTFDIAIQGNGYFPVDLPSGDTAYTRAGSFQLSPTGQLVTADGYPVQPGIVVPQDATSVTINSSGQVFVTQDGVVDPTNVGQLELALFFNEAGLDPIGQNLLLQTPASGAPSTAVPGTSGYGTVLQGFLETSNVNAVTEITDLIQAQRAYEMNSRVVSASDEMMRSTSNLR